VFGPDGVRGRVEVDEVTRSDIDRANAEADGAGIQPIKIGKSLQRVLQITRVEGISPSGSIVSFREWELAATFLQRLLLILHPAFSCGGDAELDQFRRSRSKSFSRTQC
jgi:hypothetical protein